MKLIIGLRSPACDLIGEFKYGADDDKLVLQNPCMFTWLGDYMKIIPFEACSKEKDISIPKDNIAWSYDANEKASEHHDEVVKEWNEKGCQLLTRKEYDEKLLTRQDDMKKTLKKVK